MYTRVIYLFLIDLLVLRLQLYAQVKNHQKLRVILQEVFLFNIIIVIY